MLKRFQRYETREIVVSSIRFKALIADSTVKRMIGLMYTKRLNDNECMLFIFPNSGYHGIWMHNMLFSIDIFWFDEKKKLVDYVKNVPPCTSIFSCKTYSPRKPARYVLEVKTKKISKVNLKLTF